MCCASVQNDLKEQELRNVRLSVKLQQRPEADDVRAMQQQLSFLHELMEKNSSEHELEVMKVMGEVRAVEEVKERLQRECVQLKKSLEELPQVADMNKYVSECAVEQSRQSVWLCVPQVIV